MRCPAPLSRHGAWLAAAAVPSCAWLAPVLRDPAHTLIGWEGDNLFFVRQIWWMAYALVDLRRSPFFDPLSYFPAGYSLTGGDLTPANTLAALPVTLAAGPIAAYNVMLVVSFLLTAWAAYAWAYRLSGSRGGALVASVIASMAPYRLAHATGHLNLVATQYLPLALWLFEELLRSRTPADAPPRARPWIWAAALGVALALAACASWYYAYSAAMMLPLYVALRTLRRRDLWTSAAWWRDLALAITIAAVIVAPFAVPYLRAAANGGLRRPFDQTLGWSLNFYDFLIPNTQHPWWGDRVAHVFPHEAGQWVEGAVAVGYIAPALAILALVRRRRLATRPLALAGVAVVSASIALGPFLYSRNQMVTVPAPPILRNAVDWTFYYVRPQSPYRQRFWDRRVVAVPLPSLVLFTFVPGTAGMRSLARFGYWTDLMIAGLAALAAGELARAAASRFRRPGAEAIVAGVLACVILVELWSVKSVSRWTPRDVDRWIAAQPPGDVVVEVPLGQALRYAQDYFITTQRHPTVLGPRGDSFQPPILMSRMGVIEKLPDRAALAELRAWGTTLMIAHPAAMADWPVWDRALASIGAAEVAHFGDARVYRLPRSAP